jgi:Uma2 family endonuclease
VEEKVPEGKMHRQLCNALFESVERELGERALVSSDQFLYWDPTDPKKNLAPDLAVRLGAPGKPLKSWKTWERGAPEVAVEIVSDSDASERVLADKLERYRQAGVAEVVRFDPQDLGRPLRLWDLLDGDLVERDPSGPEAHRCDALSLYWCVRRDEKLGSTLRLARDASGNDLVLTPAEAERAAKEAERAAKEAERAAKEAERVAKEAALARVAELEAALVKAR